MALVWNFRAHTRRMSRGIQNAWNAREMDGVEQHLFEAMCSLLEILVSSGRRGVKDNALRGLPPFNCHSFVFSDNEARRILIYAFPREKRSLMG